MTFLFEMARAGGGRTSAKLGRTLLVLACVAPTLLVLLHPKWSSQLLNSRIGGLSASEKMHIPRDLESIVLKQFDNLVSTGEILFEVSTPEHLIHEGFQFEFRVVPFMDRKPISSPNSPDRTTAGGPFVNPRRQEIVTDVGSAHRLLLNKYCVYRPMLVLSTTKFALQTDDLDLSDISAAWAVLKAFESPQMATYNCGAGAGSSLGHKHLQIFPLPDHKRMPLFPARATSATGMVRSISNIPFEHHVHMIAPAAQAVEVFGLYQSALSLTASALRRANAGSDYNVLFTTEWLALIPRRTAVWGGPHGANGAGMMGMVTVPNQQQQRQQWADLGYTDYLATLGVPWGHVDHISVRTTGETDRRRGS